MASPRFLSSSGRVLHGVRRVVTTGAPAAGQPVSASVPGGVRWRIMLGRFTLTTSGVVANRFPGVLLGSPDLTLWRSSDSPGLAATSQWAVSLAAGGPTNWTAASGREQNVGIPDVWLPDGYTISVGVLNIDPGDQLSGLALLVEETYATDSLLTDQADERERDELTIAQALAAGGVPSQQTPAGY